VNITNKNIEIANQLVDLVRQNTKTVSDGEGVAIVMLWSFLNDHADCHGLEIEQLARDQIEAFIKFARENLGVMRPH
jgi:hypothetical protein